MVRTLSRTPTDLFAAAMAVLLPLAFLTAVDTPPWTLRAAVLPLLALVGLTFLPRLLRQRDAPALWLFGFAAAAVVATLFSGSRLLALFGIWQWGTGLVFVLAIAGAWCLGRGLGEQGRLDVGTALLSGVLVNVGVAILQMVVDLDAYDLPRYEGHSQALLGNPVHFGALLAGAISLVLFRMRDSGRRWAAAAAAIGAVIQTSGSRGALGIALLVALYAALRMPRRVSFAFALSLVVGTGLGIVLTESAGTTSSTDRVVTGGALAGRGETWVSTRHAVARRPLVGVGPGLYRIASSRDRPLELVRREGPDRYFLDAHNLFVEYAATIGLPGMLALAGFLVAAIRRARGPLLLFALGVLAVHLVEPQAPGTTPLAFLALGAATTAPVCDSDGRATKAVRAVAAAVGVAAGAVFLVGAFHLHQGRLDFDHSHARAARQLLAPWPQPYTLTSRIFTFEGRTERNAGKGAEALVWRRRAVERDRTNPSLWNDLAEAELGAGHHDRARRAAAQALRFDPWSVRALNTLGHAQHELGDDAAARTHLGRSLLVRPRQRDIRELHDQLG